MGAIMTCVAAKLSISILLLRIVINRINAWILYGVMFVTVAIGVTLSFMLMLQCTPVSYFWDRVSQKGSCHPEMAIRMSYVYSVTSVICDFTLGLLPVALVWNMQLNSKTKVAAVCILSMGCMYVSLSPLSYMMVDSYQLN
jgi:cation-transporting ATPase 13A1